MANPVQQLAAWVVELGAQLVANWETVSTVLAAALAVYLAYVLATRLTNNNDPSIRYTSESGAGTTSILLSGVHVTIGLVVGIAALTWPTPIENPVAALMLVGAVLVHYILEKREVSMS